MFFVFLFLRVHSTTWRRFNWRVVELLEGKVLFTKKTSSPRESFRLNFRKSCDTAQHFHQAWKTQVTTGEVNITAISGERKNAGLEGWIYKIRQPGDSRRDLLIPYLEVTSPFQKVTFSPSQKGHQQNCQENISSHVKFIRPKNSTWPGFKEHVKELVPCSYLWEHVVCCTLGNVSKGRKS